MILKKADGRIWEIDFLRGVAIIIMIIFHFLYDLNYYHIYRIQLYSGPMLYIAYITATIFIVLSGISITISYSKVKQKLSKKAIILKYLKRGLNILFLGLFITLITWIYLPERFIIFGILHCIGVSIILSIILIRYKYFNLFTGIILFLIGIYLKRFSFNFNWLIPFGFIPKQFMTIDYFPLLPWFGIFIIGIAIGNLIYQNGLRQYTIKDRSNNYFSKNLCLIGRHSLLIYFIHQPILLIIIHIFLI